MGWWPSRVDLMAGGEPQGLIDDLEALVSDQGLAGVSLRSTTLDDGTVTGREAEQRGPGVVRAEHSQPAELLERP